MGLSELGAGITANAAGTTRSGPTKSCRLRITQWRKGNACHRRHLFRKGLLLGWGLPTTGALVETLLDRGSDDDVAKAEAAIERLGAAPAEEPLAIREVCLLRLRALLARARSEDVSYQDFRGRYHAMASEHGYEGHIKWAEAMP